ncbi:NAD-dependent epimerase/dehydratase family protein, partial [candidate division KSB1 bacterium]|nr:NAD-dependent epimerase/dehydratase family protein [candidate division KSB1 bacterium]
LGFIGSHLARRLVSLGADVTIMDSLIPEYGGNRFNIKGIEQHVMVNIADVRDEYSMNYLIQGKDYLFNLAGQTSHLDSMKNPFVDLDINCKAQLSILESCRRFNPGVRVVFASTRQLYGKPDYLPVDEKHPLHPIDVNGINKMAGEWYHILYNNIYGIRACVLRLTNTYGPCMRVCDARQTFVGVWIRQLLQGKPILVYGDGSQLRDFNYVDDVIDALVLAADRKESFGKIFNLGGSEPVSLTDLAKILISCNKGEGSYKFVPFPPNRKRIDIGDYYSDFERIRKALNWSPAIDLKEGFRRTIEYYRKYGQYYWEATEEDERCLCEQSARTVSSL